MKRSEKKKLKLKAKKTALKFKGELKKSMVTAIVAAFGFLIALSWRDVIVSWMERFSELSPVRGNVISAIIITIVSVIGILVISKFSHEKKKR